MAHRRFHPVHKLAVYHVLLAALAFLSACGQKMPPPSATPTITATAAPTQTATPTPPPIPTATQTSTPLPKDPTLLAIVGKGRVYATAWSPDRQAFAVSAADGVRVYQAKTHQVLAEFPQPGEASVEFSPDGRSFDFEKTHHALSLFAARLCRAFRSLSHGTGSPVAPVAPETAAIISNAVRAMCSGLAPGAPSTRKRYN